MHVGHEPQNANLFEKMRDFIEAEEPFWMSPLVRPQQVADAPCEAGLFWHFFAPKESFFKKKRFLHVLVEDPDDVAGPMPSQPADQASPFHLPHRNLALVRDLLTEVKRTIL